MTAPLKWRSQLCPCGYCPDGTRIDWRYSIDIRFKPRRRVSGGVGADVVPIGPAAANPSGLYPEGYVDDGTRNGATLRALYWTEEGIVDRRTGEFWSSGIYDIDDHPTPPRARARNGRKALEGPEAGK